MLDAPYDALLDGIDYATRGGLPMIGLEHGSSELPGLPPMVALRCWEPTPGSLSIEAINTGDTAVSWLLCSQGSGGHLQGLAMPTSQPGAALAPEGDGWRVSLPAGGRVRLDGAWAERGPLTRHDLWHGA
jgi:hypothetical protein